MKNKGHYEVYINLGFGDGYFKKFRILEKARIFARKQEGAVHLYHVYKEINIKKVELTK